jgi:hypothetical protein
MVYSILFLDPKIAAPFGFTSDVTDGGRSISVKSGGGFTVRGVGEEAGLSHRLRVNDTQTQGVGQSEWGGGILRAKDLDRNVQLLSAFMAEMGEFGWDLCGKWSIKTCFPPFLIVNEGVVGFF